jgi:hypothetical protein
MTRGRCRNEQCARQSFVERLGKSAPSHARRTRQSVQARSAGGGHLRLVELAAGTELPNYRSRLGAERSAEATARWLQQHPEVEIVSRDRCGVYAQGVGRGAPQARQVAGRFHLL